MSESGPRPLTADEREQIRRMLCRFGGVMEEEPPPTPTTTEIAKTDAVVEHIEVKDTADQFLRVPPGTTVDLKNVNTGSLRYNVVRLSNAIFRPYILDRKVIDPDYIVRLCREELGIVMHRPTAGLLTGSVEQAEPIVMFQIELAEPSFDRIETVRWMT